MFKVILFGIKGLLEKHQEFGGTSNKKEKREILDLIFFYVERPEEEYITFC